MTSLSDAVADRRAEPVLFAGLVDDAAVFPPGKAALAEAVVGTASTAAAGMPRAWVHARPCRRGGRPRRAPRRLLDGGPFRVGVIGRPGTAGSEVAAAVQQLRAAEGVEVSGVELGWTPEWRATDFGGLPLSLEVPRGGYQLTAIADIASEASDSVALQAKFRTGETDTWPWPDETELATFIRRAIDQDLGFKLTGGLHHVVRGTHDGQEQHGLLNVLATVRWALNGEEVDELVSLLAERDPAVLVPQITRMSAADAAIVRAFFTAYGCCEVTDPIGELTTLGLVQGA